MDLSDDKENVKDELLRVALDLFNQNGYDKTSINDIVRKTGVTKGAFYYYFKSKIDILEELSKNQALKIIEITKNIVDNNKLDPLKKINLSIYETQKYRYINIEHRMKIFRNIESLESLKFQHKILQYTIELGKPILKKLLDEGNTKNIFNIPFTEQLSELYIVLVGNFNISLAKLLIEDVDNNAKLEKIKQKLLFFEYTLERLLGVEKGSIVLSEVILKFITDWINNTK